MLTIIIQKNLKQDEVIERTVADNSLDLDNIRVNKLSIQIGRANVYHFTSQDSSFRWEQSKEGGIVEIFQENSAGKKLIKEIEY